MVPKYISQGWTVFVTRETKTTINVNEIQEVEIGD